MRIKHILSAVLSVFILFAVGALPDNRVSAEESEAEEFAGMMQIENEVLAVGFNETDGTAKVVDKRTGKTWTQYYMSPPEDAVIYETDFKKALEDYDNSSLSLMESRLSNFDGSVNVLVELSEMQGSARIDIGYPLPKIDVGDFKLQVEYQLIGVQECTVRGSMNFYLFGWRGLQTKHFTVFEYMGNTPEGWQIAEIPINRSELPQATDTFSINLIVDAPGTETGLLYIRSMKIVGVKNEPFVTVSNAEKTGDEITFDLNSFDRIAKGEKALKAKLSFDPKDPASLCYDISGLENGEAYNTYLRYPGTFHSGSDDLSWVLPKDSGLMLNSFDYKSETNRKYMENIIGEFYSHMGFNMAFIGALNRNSGDSCMMVIDTPICAKVRYSLADIGGRVGTLPQLFWFHDKELWKENRRVRFVFISEGGLIGMTSRYRQIADEKGFLVTYDEKAKTNPATKVNSGAHRVDIALRLSEILPFYEKMEEHGIPNLMIKLSGARDENGAYAYIEGVQAAGIIDEVVKKYPQYQLYEYECYRDLFMEAGEFRLDQPFIDVMKDYRLKQKNGSYLRGWTDASGLQSYVVCPLCIDDFLVYRNTAYPFEKYPYVYKQHDVLATVSLSEGECYDENHPCDRYITYDYRIKTLKDMKEKYNQGTHIEGAAEYLVPYCEGFEGALDIMANGGGGFTNTLNVDMADRVPLWQLVYHDCAGTYYHWEHGILTDPKADFQDLICILYGERGMFLPRYIEDIFTTGLVDVMAERIKRIDSVLQKVSSERMVDFAYISPDRRVQKTTFSSGLSVIANFSDTEYEYKGKTIKPMDFITEKPSSWARLFMLGASIVALLAVGGAAGIAIRKKKTKKASATSDKVTDTSVPN